MDKKVCTRRSWIERIAWSLSMPIRRGKALQEKTNKKTVYMGEMDYEKPVEVTNELEDLDLEESHFQDNEEREEAMSLGFV